jgi:cell wall-associated NlpC family hydrolase
LSTLLYSPGIKVYISTANNGTIDVSDDLVDGTMVRRSDGVSSFNFTLQNTRRKYDGIFAPNDRIVVTMKRISWVRVFTGYLNSVPLLTAWPRVVPLTASCSLKRLQYWYWDAGSPAAQTMVANALKAVQTGSTNARDGGMANAILTILKNVVGWPESKVHIAGIPQNWFDLAYKIAKDIDARAEEADEIAKQFYSLLQGQGLTAGIPNGGGTGVATGAMKPGNYGGETITSVMCPYIEDIYNIGKQLGATDRDLVIGMMVAMQESSMGADTKAMTTPNRFGCVGLFQQTVGSWGTLTQLHDPVYQCKKFFTALMKVKNREQMALWQAGEAVQRSGVGQNTIKHEAMARAVVTFLTNVSSKTTPPTLANDPSFKGGTSQWNTGKATGLSFLTVGLNLVKDHPNIPYHLGGDSPPNVAVPTVLDCSSFTQWVYYHTLGKLNGMPRTAAGQQSWCRKISAAQALKTRGALVFVGTSAHHVEVSLGDGSHTVGAHHSGTNASVRNSSPSYWTNGGLLPDLDYSADGGGIGTVPTGTGGGGTPATGTTTPQIPIEDNKSQPWYNPNDKFDQLFGNNAWTPAVNQAEQAYSAVFTGIRALLNDQPLLPYLKNLFNSTMRSFCSAPNGDLIGWFPDYYGLWGTAASMVVEPIEIRDFNVTWSDDFFVTHQYTTAAAATNTIDLATGVSTPVNVLNAAVTLGIATIDVPSIMSSLFGLETTPADAEKFINYVYKRFGARPDFQQLPGVVGGKGEFFSALFLFQRQWAYQYNADIPLTFMPELWPGMLIKIPAFDFQAYVTTVTHSFSFGENGGFSTSVNIAAPARLPTGPKDKSGVLIGLPVAGGLVPRTGK